MGLPGMQAVAWLVFVGAAALEVGGDAVVRRGLRGGGWPFVVAGCLLLGGYGILVNALRWDFSRLLGAYVAVFALVSVLCGRLVFREQVPATTWAGLGIILVGGLVIQLGQR